MLQDRIYVRGTVRKDAVEIIPVDVPLAAAPVLAAKYGENWVPNQIRTVSMDVGDEPITATTEYERLVRAYGGEHVAEAFGTKVNATLGISALLKLDSAQAVSDVGIIPAVGDVGISLIAPPEKGTKAYAQRAAAEAHPDDLKPVTDDPDDTAATASAQANAQKAEDDRRAAEQTAADDRRKQIADEAAQLSANKASAGSDIDPDTATNAEMKTELDARGVAYPSTAKKADLQKLLDDNPVAAQPSQDGSSDQTGENQG